MPTAPSSIRAAIRRVSTVIALVALISTIVAPSVSALSIRRTWTAQIGSAGANGTADVIGYMTGTGAMELQLARLLPSTAYPVVIFRGSCGTPAVIARMPSVISNAAGAVTTTSPVSSRVMDRIWTYGRAGVIKIKIGAGRLARCGTLMYPVATRIAIPGVRIDMPVVKPPSGYPLCNVAMFFPALSEPREGGATLLYAHARTGMFLPLLERSRINNGVSLLGATILVWTSDAVMSTYIVVFVRRHVTTLDAAFAATTEQLWVQTSEGPHGTVGKLVIKAKRIGSKPSSHAAAHPAPHPVVCH
jgi:hypothetical protein